MTSIIFEDEFVLIIEKPPRFHSSFNEKGFSYASLPPDNILTYLIEEKKIPLPFVSPDKSFGLLNRLDFETSGILVMAKTPEAYDSLKLKWKTKEVIKTYRALVSKKKPLPILPYTITTPITQRYRHSKKVIVYEEKMKKLKLKLQSTLTLLLKTHPHPKAHDLEIQIHTGVRHQIRAHLSFMGFPILGDSLYGSEQNDENMSRLFLHAWKIKLPHLAQPIECPLPLEWEHLI